VLHYEFNAISLTKTPMTVMLLALAFLGDYHKSYYIWCIAQGSQGENRHPAFQHFCQQSKPLAKFSKRVLK